LIHVSASSASVDRGRAIARVQNFLSQSDDACAG
jgi:hypothetical protein